MLVVTGSCGPLQIAQSAENNAPDGQSLVLQSVAQLTRITSLEAKLRQTTHWFDQDVAGSGTYFQSQSPRGLLLRLELKLRVGDHQSSLQQVGDGRFLWIRRDLPSGVSLGRVDMDRMRQAASDKRQPSWAGAAGNSLAVGGLPQLLAALAENFQFAAAEAMQSEDTALWGITGVWKPDRLAALVPDQKEKLLAGGAVDRKGLPAQLPTEVHVVLRQSDLLPYRIEYRRAADDPTHNADGAQPMMVLEILGIRQHEALDENLFCYQPGNQEIVDVTERYLQSLNLAPPDD